MGIQHTEKNRNNLTSSVHSEKVGVVNSHHIVDVQVALNTRQLVAKLKNWYLCTNQITVPDET